MKRYVTASLAVLAVMVVVLVAKRVLTPAELPELARPEAREVFPELDLRAASPGSPVTRIYASFGKRVPEQTGRVASTRRCVFFKYDEELFQGALAVLTNEGKVERSWVVKGAASPPECSGLPHETVELKRWYAAAAR